MFAAISLLSLLFFNPSSPLPEDPAAQNQGLPSSDSTSSNITPEEWSKPEPTELATIQLKDSAQTLPENFTRWSISGSTGVGLLFVIPYGRVGFSAWNHRWKKRFMVAGGPSLHFSAAVTSPSLMTLSLSGDLALGGGNPKKLVGYGLLSAGLIASYPVLDAVITLPYLAVGGGFYRFVTPRASVGARFRTVIAISEVLFTFSYHFGARAR